MARKLFPVLTLAALAVVILYVAGVFDTGRIKPGLEPGATAQAGDLPAGASGLDQAVAVETDELFEAVGTIRPRTQTSVEAQVTAKVLAVTVTAGDKVGPGQVLIRLDDRDLQSKLERSRQALAEARASREQAHQGIGAAQAAFAEVSSQYKRVKQLFQNGAVTSRELEQAEASYLQAEARLGQADQGLRAAQAAVSQADKLVEEASIALGYTIIKAQEIAEVARRSVEPGDLAGPGKTLLTLQTSGSLRLEAFVREGLVANVRPGQTMDVDIGSLSAVVPGVVEEVVPSADPATRTFLVKVGLPAVAGAYPGMFGRLLVPAGKRTAVLVPTSAVRRVGQMETVSVRAGDRWSTVYVKTGAMRDGRTEILSGLSGGETVALYGAAHGG